MMRPCSVKVLGVVAVIPALLITLLLAVPKSLPGTEETWFYVAVAVVLLYVLFLLGFWALPTYVNYRIAIHDQNKGSGTAGNVPTGSSDSRKSVGEGQILEQIEEKKTTRTFVPDDNSEVEDTNTSG